ncbi:class I SAM-dependent methyltransferase [Gracilibacillus phocaeensis]|uniref:class I SAM-dependent methyltransferase n=1 Tax=Gracilibacillus phocaeensis TaxID=2042304 RepID=UPI0010300DE7|nr:class I SAM-dependent methyltransferase [Gracilibacillus phocaeensis]
MKEYSVEESRKAWENNAAFWDDYMGDASNRFHRETVRPKVSELLHITADDFILDIGCGNGNYSAYLAEKGAEVVAFDYSRTMIKLAKKRQRKYQDKIRFHVIDATNKQELMTLERSRPYTKAVSNMAIMDMAEITHLFQAVYHLIEENGVFVFATQHPCFITLTDQYLTAHSYKDIAIEGQPQPHCYYRRSLQDLFHTFFQHGFLIDGFYEESHGQQETPDIIIVRARKIAKMERKWI